MSYLPQCRRWLVNHGHAIPLTWAPLTCGTCGLGPCKNLADISTASYEEILSGQYMTTSNKKPECLQWLVNTCTARSYSTNSCEICGLGPCRMEIRITCDNKGIRMEKPTKLIASSNNKQAALEAIKTILKYIEESSK